MITLTLADFLPAVIPSSNGTQSVSLREEKLCRRRADLPGDYALTFPLILIPSASMLSGYDSGFESFGLLTQHVRLFVISVPQASGLPPASSGTVPVGDQIPSRDGHPCDFG